MKENAYVYIITNYKNTTLYTGVTSNLIKRIFEHKSKLVDGFSKKYNLNKLVYFEESQSIVSAIQREKFIKGKSRQYKIDLINSINPQWCDLYESLL